MPTAREATTRLVDLLRREHHALAEFLVALSVFDREQQWIELGYSSLFYFLTRELGLSKGSAYYRKTAVELIRAYPEVLAALREGKLCLSSIVELSKVLTPENRADVLPRFFHVSKREAKEVTAELLPTAMPPLRTVATAARGGGERGVDSGHARAGAASPWRASPSADAVAVAPDLAAVGFTHGVVHPENLVHANAQVPGVASASSPRAAPARVEVQPLTAELTRLHVTVPRRLLEKLEAARDAVSHSHPRASDDEILELGLDLIVERHRKRRGIGAKARKTAGARREAEVARENVAERPETPARPAKAATSAAAAPATADAPAPPPPPPARSRHVPNAVWRAVWERDRGRCVWPVDGGGVCGATRRLQLDHVDGWALGAETTVDGCRLLCSTHDDLHARALYGDGLMNRYSRLKGAGGAERGADR